MKSVFGTHYQKAIPHSLQECTKMDGVSKSLWRWAEILESIALVLFWLNAIAGLIVGIGLGADAYDDGFLLFMAGLLGGVFAGALAYLAFFVAALMIGSLASIVENTRVSADVALFESARAGGDTVCIQTAQQPTQQPTQQEAQQEQALKKVWKDNDLVHIRHISNGKCSKCGKTSDVEQYQNKKTYEFTYYCEDCIKEM